MSTLLSVIAVCFSSCRENSYMTLFSYICDQTDADFTGFTMQEYYKTTALTINHNNGEHIRIQAITETGYNTVKEFEINKIEYRLLSNDRRRDSTVLPEYFNQIQAAFYAIDTGIHERTGSVIFKIISDELNYLASHSAGKKALYIKSDLMENSSLADFYSLDTFALLKNSPDKIRKIFLDKYQLPDLTGIEIHFMYQPKDQEDSDRFEVVSGFYKNLLESFGATVTVSGSL